MWSMYIAVLLWSLCSHHMVMTQTEDDINETVYIANGEASVELPCGDDVRQNRAALVWKVMTDDRYRIIFKYTYTTPGSRPRFRDGYAEDKYTIGTTHNTSLLLKSVQISDSKRYQCELLGSPDYKYSVYLQVVVPPDENYGLELHCGNLLDNHKKSITGPYVENEEQEFICLLQNVLPGKESTTFEFFHDIGRIVSTENDVTEYNGTIAGIKSLRWRFRTSFSRFNNGGIMTCQAHWRAGDYIENYLTTHIFQVYFEAYFIRMVISPRDRVDEGEWTFYICETDSANPHPPQVIWRVDGDTEKIGDGRFRIQNRVQNDNFEGWKTISRLEFQAVMSLNKKTIECALEGNIADKKVLEVMYPAKFQEVFDIEYTTLGASANITVQFDMHPTDSIGVNWTVGDKMIPEEHVEIVSLGEEKVLLRYHIASVTTNMIGNHTIIVTNKAMVGGNNDNMTVVILQLEGPPEKPKIVNFEVSHDKIAVTWIVGLNKGNKQHFIIQYWEQGKTSSVTEIPVEGQVSPGETMTYDIIDLKSQTKYFVQVIALKGYNNALKSQSEIIFTETTSSSNNSGTIVGVTLAMVVIVITIGVVSYFCGRRNEKMRKDKMKPPGKAQQAYEDLDNGDIAIVKPESMSYTTLKDVSNDSAVGMLSKHTTQPEYENQKVSDDKIPDKRMKSSKSDKSPTTVIDRVKYENVPTKEDEIGVYEPVGMESKVSEHSA